jgi:GAF domain-containing protein
MSDDCAPAQALSELKEAVDVARGQARSGMAAGVRPAVSSAGQIDQTAVAFNVFSKLLISDGIRAALYSVLRHSSYRFISIFRFMDGKATSCVHVDREDLLASQADEVPDTATYCLHVRNSNRPFVTANAAWDARTSNHPARDVVLSYCGVPILASDGTLIGTLCYYDLVARDPDQLDLELLLQVSSALAQSGLVPPYPKK